MMFYKLYELVWEFNNSSFSPKDREAMLPVKRAVVMVFAIWAVCILIVTIYLNIALSNR